MSQMQEMFMKKFKKLKQKNEILFKQAHKERPDKAETSPILAITNGPQETQSQIVPRSISNFPSANNIESRQSSMPQSP